MGTLILPYTPAPREEREFIAQREGLGSYRRVWPYERGERLADLVDRLRAVMEFLQRERCDAPHAGAIIAIDVRLAVLRSRFRKLSGAGRAARREERLSRSMLRPEVAEALAGASLSIYHG